MEATGTEPNFWGMSERENVIKNQNKDERQYILEGFVVGVLDAKVTDELANAKGETAGTACWRGDGTLADDNDAAVGVGAERPKLGKDGVEVADVDDGVKGDVPKTDWTPKGLGFDTRPANADAGAGGGLDGDDTGAFEKVVGTVS